MSVTLLIPPALPNQGNTCFMNSTLQILFRCPKFIQYFTNHALVLKNAILKKNKKFEKMRQVEKLIILLFDLYYTPCSTTIKLFAKECETAGLISIGFQSDVFQFCHEFFQLLCAHDDLAFFRMQFETIKICYNCLMSDPATTQKEVKYVEEMGINFSDIRGNERLGFVIQKKIGTDDTSECRNCQMLRAFVHVKNTHLPEYVIFRIDRGEDLSHFLDVEDEIVISQHDAEKPTTVKNFTYELNGFISFMGATIDSGHVVTLLKGKKNKEWFLCDDNQIKPFERKKEKDYVAFYKGKFQNPNNYYRHICLMCLYHRKHGQVEGDDKGVKDFLDATKKTSNAIKVCGGFVVDNKIDHKEIIKKQVSENERVKKILEKERREREKALEVERREIEKQYEEKMRREAEIKRKRIEKQRKEQQEHEQQMKDAVKSYQKEQKKGSGGGLLGKIGNVLGDVADVFLPGSGPNPGNVRQPAQGTRTRNQVNQQGRKPGTGAKSTNQKNGDKNNPKPKPSGNEQPAKPVKNSDQDNAHESADDEDEEFPDVADYYGGGSTFQPASPNTPPQSRTVVYQPVMSQGGTYYEEINGVVAKKKKCKDYVFRCRRCKFKFLQSATERLSREFCQTCKVWNRFNYTVK